MLPALPLIIPHGSEDSRNVAFSSFAALALLLFDISLTINEEITYIWKARWSTAKVLYLICRYIGLVNVFFLAIVNSSSDPSVATSVQFFVF
ncbi:hypothetical protein M422DRAFT_244259 [Sphaerobolus stellatus SS14]|nr:hypothetical protein M422DRAFT_244259 [Sphaerobolus stellatus SS14]